jgi:hypothetical protein
VSLLELSSDHLHGGRGYWLGARYSEFILEERGCKPLALHTRVSKDAVGIDLAFIRVDPSSDSQVATADLCSGAAGLVVRDASQRVVVFA